MSETAVERRLRVISATIDTGREDTELSLALYPEWPESIRVGALNRADDMRADKAAIDAGREAIVLLRVLLTLSELDYGDMSLFYAEEPEHPVTRAAALLARCEGEK
jgi:hypothetical protein